MSTLEYNINNAYKPVSAYKAAQKILGIGNMALGYVESEDMPYLSPNSAIVWKKTSTGEEVILKRRQDNPPHIAVRFTT